MPPPDEFNVFSVTGLPVPTQRLPRIREAVPGDQAGKADPANHA